VRYIGPTYPDGSFPGISVTASVTVLFAFEPTLPYLGYMLNKSRYNFSPTAQPAYVSSSRDSADVPLVTSNVVDAKFYFYSRSGSRIFAGPIRTTDYTAGSSITYPGITSANGFTQDTYTLDGISPGINYNISYTGS
jgi:hypothetical protein